jgi:hypothetical protein
LALLMDVFTTILQPWPANLKEYDLLDAGLNEQLGALIAGEHGDIYLLRAR